MQALMHDWWCELRVFSKEEDIFLKRLENITYHLASPRAQPEVAHTRGRRMSRGTDMIDQSYRARRETYAKPRRPRDFLSRTIKGWTMFEVASHRRAAPVPFDRGSLRLWYHSFTYDSYGSSCGISVDHCKPTNGSGIIQCELRSSSATAWR